MNRIFATTQVMRELGRSVDWSRKTESQGLFLTANPRNGRHTIKSISGPGNIDRTFNSVHSLDQMPFICSPNVPLNVVYNVHDNDNGNKKKTENRRGNSYYGEVGA